MGIAIANEACERGANVILILGPVDEIPRADCMKIINVVSAEDMANETQKHFNDSDIAILTAAVADYTPEIKSRTKIKKKDEVMIIRLKPTIDIAAGLGEKKKSGQMLVGFALETENERINARNKLKSKNLDLIVLNSLRDEGAGFRFDTNRVTIIDKSNNIEEFELKSKAGVAVDILNKIEEML